MTQRGGRWFNQENKVSRECTVIDDHGMITESILLKAKFFFQTIILISQYVSLIPSLRSTWRKRFERSLTNWGYTIALPVSSSSCVTVSNTSDPSSLTSPDSEPLATVRVMVGTFGSSTPFRDSSNSCSTRRCPWWNLSSRGSTCSSYDTLNSFLKWFKSWRTWIEIRMYIEVM